MDSPDEQISAPTFLESDLSDSWMRRAADCLASRVVEVGVILVWHGLWTTTDIITKKEDFFNLNLRDSTFFSLFVGLTGGFVLFILQFPLLKCYHLSKSSQFFQIIFYILFYIFNLCGVYVTISRYYFKIKSSHLSNTFLVSAQVGISLISSTFLTLLSLALCQGRL